MFESAVDGFGGPVAGAGSVEVGQDVSGPFLEGPAQGAGLVALRPRLRLYRGSSGSRVYSAVRILAGGSGAAVSGLRSRPSDDGSSDTAHREDPV